MNHPQSTVRGFNNKQHNPFEHVKYRIKGVQCPQNFKKDKKMQWVILSIINWLLLTTGGVETVQESFNYASKQPPISQKS
jgi:hypothetical protein